MINKLKFIYKMKTGIFLLGFLALASIIGSIIPQQMSQGWYQNNYGTVIFKVIKLFELDNIYHSNWFTVLFVLISINLIACSIMRIFKIISKIKQPFFQGDKISEVNIKYNNLKDKINNIGFRKVRERENILYLTTGKIGFLGSWLTHLGLLLIIIGYLTGTMFGSSSYITGVPGEIKQIPEAGIELKLEDFKIDYRDDYSVKQYSSHVQVFSDNARQKEVISVNDPLSHAGHNIYQVGTGWRIQLSIKKGDESLKQTPLKEGNLINLAKIIRPENTVSDTVSDSNSINSRETDLDSTKVRFAKFLPDPVVVHGSVVNRSPELRDPHLIYQIIEKDKVLDMGIAEIGDTLNWKNYNISFNQPQKYTTLQVRKDPGLIVVIIGGIILLLGIIISFYVNPRSILVKNNRDAQYSIYVYSFKNNKFFKDKIKKLFDNDYSKND